VLTEKTNHYTTIEARQAIAAGKGDPRGFEPFTGAIRAVGKYLVRRGYRDGMAGLAYAMDRAYYKFLVQAKRWDESRAGTRQAKYDQWREEILTGFANWDPDADLPAASVIAQNGHGSSRSVWRSAKRIVRRATGSSTASAGGGSASEIAQAAEQPDRDSTSS
jgi:hypothetical protein